MSPAALWAMIGGAVILGVGVPWLLMRMLATALLDRPGAVMNYRGEPVSPGLGVVWLIWAGTATAGGLAMLTLTADSMTPVLTVAGPLALVAFAAGLIDDAYGTGDAKGFRGHLSAMFRGRLTTGGLKLVAIGLASLAAALVIGEIAPWGRSGDPEAVLALRYLGGSLMAGASIALTSNLVNLMDLRPGRALKVYGLLALFGVVSTAAAPVVAGMSAAADHAVRLADGFAIAAFAAGPIVAVWRFDLGERGMLGDAGANPMGAVAGLLIVTGLPLWALAAYTALVLALNAASERVSYTRIIEANRFLSRLDGVGRRGVGTHPHISAKHAPHDQA